MTRYATPIPKCPNDGWPAVEDHAGLLLDGRFKLERLLGVGGMGSTVWSAQQTSMRRRVAIKLLPSLGEITAQKFEREARIVASLRHPNIVATFDYGQTNDAKLYLVMEHLQGKTLEQVIRRESTLGVKRTCYIAIQVLRALSHAHDKRVVHRDLKPSNLFLCSTDHDSDFAKVLDFGLAKTFGDEDEDGQYSDPTGQRQTVCGTPTYMSPEQWRGQTDNRADLYALGVIMFRMLTGRAPFVGGPDYELYHRVISEPVPPISSLVSAVNVPEQLEGIIIKALAKRAHERYRSAHEMRQELEQFMHTSLAADTLDTTTLEPPTSTSHSYVAPYSTSVESAHEAQQIPFSASVVSTARPPRRRPFFWMGFGAAAAVGCGLIVSALTESQTTVETPSALQPHVVESAPVQGSAEPRAKPSVGTLVGVQSRGEAPAGQNIEVPVQTQVNLELSAFTARARELEVRESRRGEELDTVLPEN